MINIKQLSQNEKYSTRPLYEEMFSEDSKEFVDYYYSEKTKDNKIYVVCEKDPVSMIHLNPYEMMVNGKTVSTHYIVAVATKPQFRRKGYMAALLKKSMSDLEKSGEPFTFLMPAKEEYYTPFGFSSVYRQNQNYVKISDTIPERIKEYKFLAQKAQENLSTEFQVFVKRTEQYYKRLEKEYACEGGTLVKTERNISLEFCIPAIRQIPQEHSLIMIRILSLKHMMELLKAKDNLKLQICVVDEIIPSNNKIFEITGLKNQYLKVKIVKNVRKPGINIEDFQLFIFGKINAEELRRKNQENLSLQETEELQKVIPLTKIYLNETV